MITKRTLGVRLYAWTFGPAGNWLAFMLVALGIWFCKWQLSVIGLLALRAHDSVRINRKTD